MTGLDGFRWDLHEDRCTYGDDLGTGVTLQHRCGWWWWC
jgi:hypothetical protein